jgi:hypothetical protein
MCVDSRVLHEHLSWYFRVLKTRYRTQSTGVGNANFLEVFGESEPGVTAGRDSGQRQLLPFGASALSASLSEQRRHLPRPSLVELAPAVLVVDNVPKPGCLPRTPVAHVWQSPRLHAKPGHGRPDLPAALWPAKLASLREHEDLLPIIRFEERRGQARNPSQDQGLFQGRSRLDLLPSQLLFGRMLLQPEIGA